MEDGVDHSGDGDGDDSVNIRLLDACREGNVDLVRFLVRDEGADSNYEDVSGFTPLLSAVYYAHDAVVRFLVEEGARTPTWPTPTAGTPPSTRPATTATSKLPGTWWRWAGPMPAPRTLTAKLRCTGRRCRATPPP